MSVPTAKPPTLLVVDPDPATQRTIAQAFHQSGAFLIRYVGDPKKTAAALSALQPELLLVHAELQSPVMEEVFRAIVSEPMFASLPVVLLAKDVSDLAWAAQFRSGVVHVLQEPFQPERHVEEVKALLRGLPSRTGTVHGRGQGGELAALIAHLKRAQRSGALTLDAARPQEARALFRRGGLLSASFRGQIGDAALRAMVGSGAGRWSFSELAGHAGDGAGVVIDVGGDDEEPMVLEVVAENPGTPASAAPAVDELGALLSPRPATTTSDELEALLSPAPPPKPKPSPEAPPISILLVDDDPELLRMFTIILQRRGAKVTTAADGVEGYERARSAPFDVLVADLSMPRLDGWGLLRQVRDDYRTRELPVAFLSCHDDYRESLQALDAGAQAYLSKSVKHDVLASQIRGLIQPRRQVQADLQAKKPLQLPIDSVGAQWLVQELSRQGVTGRLDAADAWAGYQLSFRDGQVVASGAQAGPHHATGEPAFIAFLASRSANGSFTFGDPGAPADARLGHMDQLIDRAVLTLNEKERRAREALLMKAQRIVVDQPLYQLYAQVGPPQWLETARLICEDHLPPAEVIARSEASPIDVEETLKDLIRRGVVSLEA